MTQDLVDVKSVGVLLEGVYLVFRYFIVAYNLMMLNAFARTFIYEYGDNA